MVRAAPPSRTAVATCRLLALLHRLYRYIHRTLLTLAEPEPAPSRPRNPAHSTHSHTFLQHLHAAHHEHALPHLHIDVHLEVLVKSVFCDHELL